MASVTVDLTGNRFGRLVVTDRGPDWISPTSGKRKTTWLCRCDCGTETVVRAASLRIGKTRSCGCIHQAKPFKHGMYGTPTYLSWASMLARCTRPKNKAWRHYGGRGITVCARWRDFANFYAYMGERPAGTSLDRIDVNGNYEPGNVRWATATEQRHNRRPTPTIKEINP